MAVTVAHAVISLLLALAVLVEAVCCAGILVMKTPLQRLHFAGLASMICPVLVALAIAVSKNPLSGAALKAFFIAAVVVVFAPVISHATGRTAVARRGPDHP
jgi:multisubunit Na+/H+ antiporter MnhG subunit